MRMDLSLSGVFTPALLLAAVIAYALNGLLRRALGHAGVYRYVWHRPLFNLALYVILLGLVVWGGSLAGLP
jgi:hypothetical protein